MSRSMLAVTAFALSAMACGGADPGATTNHLTFKTAGSADVVVNVGETNGAIIASGQAFQIEAPGQMGWYFTWEPGLESPSAITGFPIDGDTYSGTITTSYALRQTVKVRFSLSDDRTATLVVDVTP